MLVYVCPGAKFRNRKVTSPLALGPETFVTWVVDSKVTMCLYRQTEWPVGFHAATEYLGMLISESFGGGIGQVRSHTLISHVHLLMCPIAPWTELESLLDRNNEHFCISTAYHRAVRNSTKVAPHFCNSPFHQYWLN